MALSLLNGPASCNTGIFTRLPVTPELWTQGPHRPLGLSNQIVIIMIDRPSLPDCRGESSNDRVIHQMSHTSRCLSYQARQSLSEEHTNS